MMLHEIGIYIPEWLIGFIVGFIFSPLIIYGIMEYVEYRKKKPKLIEDTITKKEAKEKLNDIIEEIDQKN